MEFKEFKKLHQTHIQTILQNKTCLYTVDIDKDELWNTYLESFPEGSQKTKAFGDYSRKTRRGIEGLVSGRTCRNGERVIMENWEGDKQVCGNPYTTQSPLPTLYLIYMYPPYEKSYIFQTSMTYGIKNATFTNTCVP